MRERRLPHGDPLRVLGDAELVHLLDDAIDSWPRHGLSHHLAAEIGYVQRVGWKPGDIPALRPDESVPGCACAGCTGLSDEEPKWSQQRKAPQRKRRRESWELHVERARNVPVVEVARRLGCGDPVQRGREVVVPCPLHEDAHPSLRIASEGVRWYCFPCAEGGDGIRLVERALGLGFVDAVRWLVRTA